MSDRKSAAKTPDSPSPAPTVRRISNPRPKKASNKPVAASPAADDVTPPVISGGEDIPPATSSGAGILPASSAHPVVEVASAPEETLATPGDWPEPEASSNGGQAMPDGKRKRRRRKGKGQSANAQGTTSREESQSSNELDESPPADLSKPHRAPHPQPQPQPQPQSPRQQASRPKVDPQTHARKAWKIFLAEVSEEGVALISDQDARELARRCFRLAELFIEEQSRHLPGGA
jgi:hypothetical protein